MMNARRRADTVSQVRRHRRRCHPARCLQPPVPPPEQRTRARCCSPHCSAQLLMHRACCIPPALQSASQRPPLSMHGGGGDPSVQVSLAVGRVRCGLWAAQCMPPVGRRRRRSAAAGRRLAHALPCAPPLRSCIPCLVPRPFGNCCRLTRLGEERLVAGALLRTTQLMIPPTAQQCPPVRGCTHMRPPPLLPASPAVYGDRRWRLN